MNKNVSLLCLLKTLADEVNLKILSYLFLYKELCVCDLQSLILTTQPTVSRHLKDLSRVKLISVRKSGKWHYYSLNNVDEFVIDIIKMSIKEYKIKSTYKPKICEVKRELKNGR
jgi:DNA-binding transcriptional ArsR family regulator